MHPRTAIIITEVILDGAFTEKEVRQRLGRFFSSSRKAMWTKTLFDFISKSALDSSGQVNAPKLIQRLTRRTTKHVIPSQVANRLHWIAWKKREVDRPIARMLPTSETAAAWNAPSVTTSGQLADFLGLPLRKLDWFVDSAGRESHQTREPLRHYRYRWLDKPSGGRRLLESPKPELKRFQRVILSQILNRIPAHPAAHAFVSGRSACTAAQHHCGKDVVLRIDLREFFLRIRSHRIFGIFRTAGYPQPIAERLTGLCTNTTSRRVLSEVSGETNEMNPDTLPYLIPHLAQGAPTSPALANLVAYRLDVRLTAFAKAVGATYTRYADDLVFSGDKKFGRTLERAKIWISAICLNEGFEIRNRKTLIQRRHQRQQVHGIVVNETPGISRRQRDQLKAILHHCRTVGPVKANRQGVENFREHLEGRIAAVTAVNVNHGQKLKRQFDQIVWERTD